MIHLIKSFIVKLTETIINMKHMKINFLISANIKRTFMGKDRIFIGKGRIDIPNRTILLPKNFEFCKERNY